MGPFLSGCGVTSFFFFNCPEPPPVNLASLATLRDREPAGT